MGSICKKILTKAAIEDVGLPSAIWVLYTPDWYLDS